MDLGYLESGVFFLFIILYLLPAIFVIYWMVKMLNNSSQNLKVNRQILEILKKQENER